MKLLLIYTVKFTQVIYGDTFRVFGLDTPEIFRPSSDSERVSGILARDRACQVLLDKEIKIKLHGTEKNRRALEQLFLPDNRDYTNLMIQEGFSKIIHALTQAYIAKYDLFISGCAKASPFFYHSRSFQL